MTSEAEAIQAIVAQSEAPVGEHVLVPRGEVFTTVTPPGWTLHQVDTEVIASAPRRSRGLVKVHDAASFVHAVKLRLGENPDYPAVVYADEERMQLVAVLNDDYPDEPGWRDHRVELTLRPRPEWLHWRAKSGSFLDQEKFAEHIEEGLPELVNPSAADMLDLAQTFQASTSGRFKQSGKLASGAVQFVYEEDIEATAGVGGTLAIPEKLTLGVAPFFGSDRFEVTARFRYRLKAGELTLGYILDRPLEVERAAFGTVRDTVATDLGVDPIAGPAPDVVEPRGE